MKTTLILFIAILIPWTQAHSTDGVFKNLVKTKLIFKEDPNPPKGYPPHILLVYLHLENDNGPHLTWTCDPVSDIEAELFDSKGKPVPMPPSAASILSNTMLYSLPSHSNLDWMISSIGGISMLGDTATNIALIIGDQGWLIPRKTLSSYSLRLQVKGIPYARRLETRSDFKKLGGKVFFEIPLTPIKLQ